MRLTRFTGPRNRREHGNITIEMALALPLFLFLVAGVLDLGMLFWEKNVITNAAREGARAAAKAVDTVLVGTVGGLPPGYKTLPLAVDSDKLPSNGQKLVIHLNPTNLDDGCWHTFFWQNPAASLLRDIINGDVETPLVRVGDDIKVKEGVSDSDLKELGRALSKNGGTWDVVLPVIPPDAHTGYARVLGFAAVRMTLVDAQGQDKRVEFETLNNKLAPTTLPGGSTYYGLSTGAPRLVN
jgi:TadE-like protein